MPASSAVTPARQDGEIGECHVPETHAIPLALDSAAGEHAAFTIFGTDYPTPDGTAVRDYVHVSDIADAHVLALHALLQGGESEALDMRLPSRVRTACGVPEPAAPLPWSASSGCMAKPVRKLADAFRAVCNLHI